jgi:hypothetical protein
MLVHPIDPKLTGLMKIAVCMIILLCAACTTAVQGARTESLEEKLRTVTDYVPKAVEPKDQLVEVARKFKIPMGIEWVERASAAPAGRALPSGKRLVRELIEEIASVAPEYRIEVDDGLVRVYSPAEAVHSFNFLNIRLKSYSVKEADLFAAEDQLRWAIRFTLEPEKYQNGYGGGYGHGANHVFQIPKFTLSGSDLTIRDVLNRITLAQGNAAWVATIKSSDLEGDEPCWTRKGVDGGDFPITSRPRWHFFPLAEIAELAKERVAIDVLVLGILDQRMTTIPIMLDHGLAGNAGGTTVGSSSDKIRDVQEMFISGNLFEGCASDATKERFCYPNARELTSLGNQAQQNHSHPGKNQGTDQQFPGRKKESRRLERT